MSVVRCYDNDEADAKVQELLHHITIADGYHAPQPEHREIWIVGLHVKEMIRDELNWFRQYADGRIVLRVNKALDLYSTRTDCNWPLSLGVFLCQSRDTESNYFILRKMLSAEEYEHLMAYLLREHPNAQDVTAEDYVLNLFVEHEKNKET